MRAARPTTALCALPRVVAAWLLAASATAASAQELRDLNDLARAWTYGQWATPLVCELNGEPRRGLRRVLVGPASRDLVPRSNKLVFEPLKLPPEAGCTIDTGERQPDVGGAVYFHLEGHSRPDISDHDFQEALQREGGFEFKITKGTLQIDERPVDFAFGRARFEVARRGTDAWRRLQDLPGAPKLVLTLEAKDGTRLAFDLVRTPPPTR
ncbi:MAG TPA: hypothetical protein VHQ66_13140 [Myxococcota bacterium]|nr:hypothetical protein [Myxococcota bacterium]